MSLPGLDAWLEAPYVQAAKEAEAFEAWCEQEGLDPDAPGVNDAYDEHLEDLLYNEVEDGPDPDRWRDEQWDRDNGFGPRHDDD